MKHPQRSIIAPLLLSLAGVVALSACDRRDDQTVGQKLDENIAAVDQKTDEMKADAERNMAEMKADSASATAEMRADTADATAEMKADTANAMNNVQDKAADAAITAKVNAALAADGKLSAMKINVDTQNGQVYLRGTAPDAEALTRATELANNVKGVVSVRNELSIEKS